MKKVLVVAVHPDDETLGCGGTLLKHKAAGDKIYWCIVTSIPKDCDCNCIRAEDRELEIEKVTNLYRFDKVIRFNFPTTHLDEIARGLLISSFAKVVVELEPDVIYLPFKNDIHSDHKIAFEAAYSCTKSFRYSSVRRILMMETLSETDFAPALPSESFAPNYFVDISDFLETKLLILKEYMGEMAEHPFPRSEKNIRSLATLRGATVNCNAAESFMLLKEVA